MITILMSFVLADQVQIASLNQVDCFCQYRPAHFFQCSFSRSLCCLNTANNYLWAYKTKERWLPSSHLARQSNGSKLPLLMDAPTLLDMLFHSVVMGL